MNERLMGNWTQERVRSLFWMEFMYTPRWLSQDEWNDCVAIWDTMHSEKGSGYACVKAVAQFLGLDLDELPNNHRKGW